MLFLIPTPAPVAPANPVGPFAGVAGQEEFRAEHKETPPELLHIPCPQGHELETPRDMLNQEVLCPQCGAQFRLREKDSVEFIRRKEAEEERRANKAGNMWLNGAITVAVVVILALIGIIVFGPK